MARFLTGRQGGALLWACIDPDSLCTAPAIGDRRFPSYLAPFASAAEARQALVDAGCDGATIIEEIKPRRCRRGRG